MRSSKTSTPSARQRRKVKCLVSIDRPTGSSDTGVPSNRTEGRRPGRKRRRQATARCRSTGNELGRSPPHRRGAPTCNSQAAWRGFARGWDRSAGSDTSKQRAPRWANHRGSGLLQIRRFNSRSIISTWNCNFPALQTTLLELPATAGKKRVGRLPKWGDVAAAPRKAVAT